MSTGIEIDWSSDEEHADDESALAQGDALPVMDAQELPGAFEPKPNHLVEPARSNRSSCCGCQQRIAKGDARFGSLLPVYGGLNDKTGYGFWYHLSCFPLSLDLHELAASAPAGAGPDAVLEHCEDRLATHNLDHSQMAALVARLLRRDRTPATGKRARAEAAEAGSEAAPSSALLTPPRRAIKAFVGSPPTLCRKHGLRFSADGDVFEKLNFVVTGFFPQLPSALGGKQTGKDYLRRMIECGGGKVKSCISGQTAFLVVGRGAGPSKVASAEQYGVPVIDPDGLAELSWGREPAHCVPESLSTDFRDEVAVHNLAGHDAT